MEPITEHRLVSGLIVYGYLRLPAPAPARRAALTLALTSYCTWHELVLAGVFTDHTDDQVVTAAFAGLMDALGAAGSYGVVVPSPAHLGGPWTAQQRLERIAATGRRLMLLRGASTRRRVEYRTARTGRPADHRGPGDAHLR
ncbi:MAG: hypothetical protein GEV03_22120 [Streptosporangiales bacterium]|nr:hypothetical protein [Streptosporangiales bacterium]